MKQQQKQQEQLSLLLRRLPKVPLWSVAQLSLLLLFLVLRLLFLVLRLLFLVLRLLPLPLLVTQPFWKPEQCTMK